MVIFGEMYMNAYLYPLIFQLADPGSGDVDYLTISQCVRNSLLVWIPSAMLLLSVPLYLCYLARQPYKHSMTQFSVFSIVKLVSQP